MDNNQRPHSRKKTVGTGSAQVHVGHQVNTGSGSVGGASHAGGSHAGGGSGSGRRARGRRQLSRNRALITTVE